MFGVGGKGDPKRPVQELQIKMGEGKLRSLFGGGAHSLLPQTGWGAVIKRGNGVGEV